MVNLGKTDKGNLEIGNDIKLNEDLLD